MDVEEAIGIWAAEMAKLYDEPFGLCLGGDVPRWQARLGPPATEAGYHGVSQDSTYYALALLRLGTDVERAQTIIRRVLEAQVSDPDSHRYGEFKLIYEAAGNDVLDGNTIFFVCIGLIPIVKEYGHLLDDELVDRLHDAFALVPPRPPYERCLGVSYTNRWLGNFAIWLSICELLGDGERFELARQHFNHFYDVNMTRGFPERLSMTYYMVDIIALGMMLKYVSDPQIRCRTSEMLSVFLEELLFFEDRQPLPARRAYNQHTGAALKWSAMDWVLGAIPESPRDFATIVNNRGPHGFVEDAGWLTLAELAMRDVVDPAAFVAPAPRQMRGRHVDEIGYTSYFHPAYTLGTFDYWPPWTVGKQHESDIPVAFAGAGNDLVYFGMYSIDGDDTLKTHPGSGSVATKPGDAMSRLHYVAAQQANVACVLTNITGMYCEMKEVGWMLRGLRYGGELFDCNGNLLTGEGTVPAGWIFLRTNDYVAGICSLTHYDPMSDMLSDEPTSLRYVVGDGCLDVYAPNFTSPEALALKGNNLPAGAILVLGSAKDAFDSFRDACLAAEVTDEWYVDGYDARYGYRDCERRIGIAFPGAHLRLVMDYLTNNVLERSFNDRPITVPNSLSTIKLGITPV